MGGLEIAKEIVRIGSTAGLSKDVVDLLEKKSTLLAEQVATFEKENARLKAKISQLESKITTLQTAQPTGFVESEGVLWKRSVEGFDRRPHCPVCASSSCDDGVPARLRRDVGLPR